MNEVHFKAFLTPSVEVLQKMARTPMRVRNVGKVVRPLGEDTMCIVIGIDGSYSGSVILASSRDAAWALASQVAQEDLGPDAEEEVAAVLSEVANTILGHAVGHLVDLGLSLRITPPSVTSGSDESLEFLGGVESLLISIETAAGILEIVTCLD